MSRFLLPLAVFAALVALLAVGLTLNPREVPSPLVGQPLPPFELPRLRYPDRALSNRDLQGRVTLLNVWATWCVGCRLEHELLMKIATESGVPLYGLNYKDQRDDALRWLAERGDPYVASGVDPAGHVGIDFGVYGLPETFVLDADGRVAHKHIGPLTERDWERTLAPLIRRLQEG